MFVIDSFVVKVMLGRVFLKTHKKVVFELESPKKEFSGIHEKCNKETNTKIVIPNILDVDRNGIHSMFKFCHLRSNRIRKEIRE